uniref:Uncharacterized protein n=1 Tax=Papilio xuthus TaxID=66420 RepID=I4DNG5_PAPXU|nr:unknown secreted protein [Papilio xuthus]
MYSRRVRTARASPLVMSRALYSVVDKVRALGASRSAGRAHVVCLSVRACWMLWRVRGAAALGAHHDLSRRRACDTLVDLVLRIIFVCFEFNSILKLRRVGIFHVS